METPHDDLSAPLTAKATPDSEAPAGAQKFNLGSLDADILATSIWDPNRQPPVNSVPPQHLPCSRAISCLFVRCRRRQLNRRAYLISPCLSVQSLAASLNLHTLFGESQVCFPRRLTQPPRSPFRSCRTLQHNPEINIKQRDRTVLADAHAGAEMTGVSLT